MGHAIVRFIRARPWYLTSIALGLAAIGFEAAAKSATAAGVRRHAEAAQARADGVPAEALQRMHEQGSAAISKAGRRSLAGLLIAAVAIVCGTLSILKNESRWQSIPLIVLFVYVGLLFLLI